MLDEQLLRYSRQILLPDFDIAGQQALLAATVLVVGAGGLGSAVLPYLAGAGVGRLRVVDGDHVDMTNFHRQVIHKQQGEAKAVSAARFIEQLNPGVMVEAVVQRFNAENASQLLGGCTVAVDCSDNLETRHLLNRLCFEQGVKLVSGAAIGWEGQLCCFDYEAGSGCYQCLYPAGMEQNLNCSEAGVMGPVVGIVGTMQALEVIKMISGVGIAAVNRLMLFDGKTGTWSAMGFAAKPHCPVCGSRR
ncbi:HesA/MoeB/ThiF family protein [Gynuella sunshinyii]|uniref:Dinucleotide-utilizing enzyme involved in molybdopterin and thiamine biosynthesis family 2 n=1 Tax=Gynuella sunshinyii YC6258 TaxID=1445510 RepID=A0A0C5W133_9GAMM|nr:molybdopterin-synthase adenylyltransferase MoeB [Gynuella sunshinyii]AJQ96404.1 dinucleotide-utilizing enzyme involved in molybdopterin and thiamine biosynthesis family 2 [Gynuella sunshinyii YC6258]